MKNVVIIGGGPAGLTAAYELAKKNLDYQITIIERETQLGGISRTLEFEGNRIDIGGHRFFSKSTTVMNWWKAILPLQGAPSYDDIKLSRNPPLCPNGPNPEQEDRVMLVRDRLSRILFLRKFFNYPVSLNACTLLNLGLIRVIKMAWGYAKCLICKRKENNLEDFFINRFGEELYKTFFRDYTEKVWGVPCHQIGADWGAQRVKGLSIVKVILHALAKLIFWRKENKQSGETSLIEEFWYPKYGPGQLWETVGLEAQKMGVKILRNCDVCAIDMKQGKVTQVRVRHLTTGEEELLAADEILSTTSIQELIRKMGVHVPAEVKEVSEGLVYRDFMTVGLLLDKLQLKSKKMNTSVGTEGIVPDNWIYIQEPDVKVGRLQIFNNWSPYLVSDPNKVWIGMEYFVNEGESLWIMDDEKFCDFAQSELAQLGIIDNSNVIKRKVYRIQKAYPAYFGSYAQFDTIRTWTDKIPNLYLIGRNGMHRYNNMDHSMLSAMAAVDCMVSGTTQKDSLWNINAEKEYHEAK